MDLLQSMVGRQLCSPFYQQPSPAASQPQGPTPEAQQTRYELRTAPSLDALFNDMDLRALGYGSAWPY
eukprot:4516132-Pyramimonas_sp.AAC.1